MDRSTIVARHKPEEQAIQLLQLVTARPKSSEASQLLEYLTTLNDLLDDKSPGGARVKEVFRIHQGFEIIWTSLRSHLKARHRTRAPDELEFLHLLASHLLVICAAIAGSPLSDEHFLTIGGDRGAWASLEESLESIFAQSRDDVNLAGDTDLISRVFGVLLAVSLRRESLNTFFSIAETSGTAPDKEHTLVGAGDIQKPFLEQDGLLEATIYEPKLVTLLLKLCVTLSRVYLKSHGIKGISQTVAIDDTRFTHGGMFPRLIQQVYAAVSYLASMGDHNLTALHHSDALVPILHFLVDQSLSDIAIEGVVDLPRKLLTCGLPSLEAAESLLMASESSQGVAGLLLDAIRSTREPPHFTFDLSLAGYASLELPDLASPFPSPEPAKGYSVMLWLRVERYDDSCHTTLFGAFDDSQTCFVLIYLERKHRQLVLQTSLSTKDPSVRFKSVNLEEHRFYHVTVVHQRSRSSGPARALLFLDGVFQEQVRCAFPKQPPQIPSAVGRAQNSVLAPVQAFFGTPHDLSPKLGPGLLYSRWSLATGHLFNDALPEEIIMVYQKLGPLYRGNFQDCLGSFQTYDASAVLNLYDESLPQDGRGQSIISAAIHSQGSKLNPESNILLSVSPSFTISTPAASAFPLGHHIEATLPLKVANAVVPSLLKAPARRNGLASVMGGTTQHRPLSMQEALWRLSGCVPLVMQRVAQASTADSFISAVELFFESFRYSWRNSEAMERRHGFGVLALLFRSKLLGHSDYGFSLMAGVAPLPAKDMLDGKLALRLLELILRSTTHGYDTESSTLITNPLAFRILVIDSDIWHHAGLSTQRLFYQKILVLSSESRHSGFNFKRLIRMRAVKRLIEIMKNGWIAEEACGAMICALAKLVEKSMDAETLRAIALYITYALQSPSSRVAPSGPSVSVARYQSSQSFLSKFEVGVRVLDMLTDLICYTLGKVAVLKITRSVTTKWLLYLLGLEDARIVISAFRLLLQMLISGGQSFRAKFEARQGYLLLRLSIRKWYTLEDVWLMTFAFLFAVDLSETRSRRLEDLSGWFTGVEASGELEVICPAAWELLQDLLEEALRAACANVTNKSTEKPQQAIDRDLLLFVLSLMSAIYSQVATFREHVTSENLARTFLAVLFFGTGSHESMEESSAEDSSITKTEQSLANDGAASATRRLAQQSLQSRVDPSDKLRPLAPVNRFDGTSIASNVCFCDVTRLLVTVLIDQVLDRQDFPGLGLFLKAPPASDGKRSWLISFVLCRVLLALKDRLSNDVSVFQSPKIITNLVRFSSQCQEASLEGWFVDGGHELILFLTTFLDRVQDQKISNFKSVRLCAPLIQTARATLVNLITYQLVLFQDRCGRSSEWPSLLRSYGASLIDDIAMLSNFLLLVQSAMRIPKLSDHDDVSDTEGLWDTRFLPPMFCLLYWYTRQGTPKVRSIALEAIRILFAHNTSLAHTILQLCNTPSAIDDFKELLGVIQNNVNELALSLIEARAPTFDAFMHGSPETAVSSMIQTASPEVTQKVAARCAKRRVRLHDAHLRDLAHQHAWTEHEISMRIWNENISNSEELKSLRVNQDRQENHSFLLAQFSLLRQQQAASELPVKIQPQRVDEGEGRDRMRLRLTPSRDATDLSYRPKRSKRSNVMPSKIRESQKSTDGLLPTQSAFPTTSGRSGLMSSSAGIASIAPLPLALPEDDFEMVDDPSEYDRGQEDKNRKVMRSLQRGEQVVNVYNISQIKGLEALESLLIVGRIALYIIDGLFQRSDGEVVHTSQAPNEERDPFVQLIAGHELQIKVPQTADVNSSTKHWPWAGIVSISKRTFLLRPVAVEIFFEDGRSYLLVAVSEDQRDDLYSSLFGRSLRLQESPPKHGDHGAWRVDLLPNPKEAPLTVAGRFANAFSSSSSIPATQRWIRGEISNFQYLMIVNTMAGRTFNDLTQYPIFPWILADYTSAQLDLTNPRSFRDLSKPMGCQNLQREAAFRERYNTFADMNENQTPAFHYGTHYSSAMIVTSYLIRLKPYVDAYLLLQGGSFDHADRLFYSIERTWASASQTNMSDVRELTPEFFYLPEFLTNSNGYDFGTREADGARIGHVQLPPWAQGDPRIFIWKHREALESPYVSQNLHAWIDLVFGFKQRGEEAIEAVNVFHHLSYEGSRDIDNIDDPMERLATIGIIHNFGQTPRQVFFKAHPQRVTVVQRPKRLHNAADTLIRLPSPKYEYMHPIVELEYVQSQQRLLFCGPGRTCLSLSNLVLEWANAEGSVRFFAMDNGRPLGLFEGLHQDDILTARFADSTLLTASKDCTIGLWNVTVASDIVDLQLNEFLFGHRHPVSVIAVSHILGIILSADMSGRTILWDLNTHEAIREFSLGSAVICATINHSNGHLLLVRRQNISLYSINGDLILESQICLSPDDSIACCAFYESSGNDWIDAELLFTGHRHGVANVWKVVFDANGYWNLELVRPLNHISPRVDGSNYQSTITAIRPTDACVYTGDDDGRVFEWTIPR